MTTERDELDDLQAQLGLLRAKVDRLATGMSGFGDASSSRQEPSQFDRPTDRRTLLRRAGAAAAGAVAGGSALALTSAGPASADSGDALILGNSTQWALDPTGFRFANHAYLPTWHFFSVQDGTYTSSLFPSVIAGMMTTNRLPNGVLGQSNSDDGAGVVGFGTGSKSIGGLFTVGTGGKSNLRINTAGPTPQTRNSNGAFVPGDVVGDGQDDVWLCVNGGMTGSAAKFRKMGGPATAGQLHVLPSTVRCYDSRPGYPPSAVGPKTPMGSKVTRTIDLQASATGVPNGATAVLVNCTITNTSPAGFLALFKGDIAWPGNSTVNWDHAGQSAANLAVVAVDANVQVRAYNGGGPTDVIIDVIGYYQ